MRAILACAALVACALSPAARAAAEESAAWPNLARPLPPENRGSKDAALLVAVERYAELPPVPGALKNATDWQTYLTGTRGVPAESVTLLRDNEGTVEKLRKYARQAAEKVKPGGTLWFIFIGHGAPAQDGKDGVLVGYDAQQDADSVYARSLAQKDLLASLHGGKQAKTVVVLDACFSGRARDGKALVKGLQPLVVITGALNKAVLSATTILTAAKSNQFAGPLPGASRPAFSYLVLGGMRGWADENSDGHVTAREIVDYSQKVLTATVKERSQDPQLITRDPDYELSPAVEKAPDLAAIQRGTPSLATTTQPAANANRLVTVAVSEFRAQGLPADLTWLGRSFGDALIARLAKGKQVRVVEREYLDQIAAELKLQSSAAVDERSAVTMGRLLGARVFVFGSVALLGDEALVRARTVSVERGEVLDSVEVTGDKRTLLALQRELAQKIAASLAIDAAISNDHGLEVNQLTLVAYGDLDRLRELARGVPFFGLDAARARKRSDYQLAISICDRLLAQYPNLAPAHFYRGLFALHAEDFARADQEAQIAAKLNGQDDVEVALLLANARYVQHDGNGALARLIDATVKHADDARAWYGAARVLAEQNQAAAAAANYLDALARQPFLRAAETNLQTLLGGPNAPAVLAELRATRPERYASAAIFTAFWHHDATGASELAVRAQADMPTLYLAPYMRGVASLVRGDNNAAIGFFEQALQLRPTAPEVHRELGLSLLRSGNCALGRNHEILYFKTATAISDGDAITREMQSCRQ